MITIELPKSIRFIGYIMLLGEYGKEATITYTNKLKKILKIKKY